MEEGALTICMVPCVWHATKDTQGLLSSLMIISEAEKTSSDEARSDPPESPRPWERLPAGKRRAGQEGDRGWESCIHSSLGITNFAWHSSHIRASRDAGKEAKREKCGGFLFVTVIMER